MRIPRIHTPQSLGPAVELALEKPAVRHLVQVLRMGAGDRLQLFNGDGRCWDAEIHAADKRWATVRVIGEATGTDVESPLAIHLGIAVSKGDRMDWVMQKATELGVTAITPLFTRRVDVRLSSERREKKARHWQQVLISACEQCGRNRLPTLNDAQSLDEWLTSVREESRLVLAPGGQRLETGGETPRSAALLIGPEGGLDGDEIDAARKREFALLGLGPRILRTETAPVAALAILQYLWGDM